MNSNWKECKLGELCCDISYGYTESASLEPIGPKFLRITDIAPGRVSWTTVPYCKISNEDHTRYKLQEGDIVIARTGATTGYTYTIKPRDLKYDAIFASYLIRYRVDNQKAEPFFVGHLLTSTIWKGFVEGILGGSAQPGANAKQFSDFEILLPPLSEQRAIAGVLSSLDDKIDLLHRQNKTLEGMAEALWRKMFVDEAKTEWKQTTISEIIEVRDGTHDSPKQTKNGFHLITSRHLKEEGIDYANAYRISAEDYKQINKRSKVEKNDLLFSMIGTLGLLHYVNEEPSFAIKNIGLFKSSKKPEFAKFLYLLLKSPIGKDFIFENADGSTQEYIALGSLRSFVFAYPGEQAIKMFDKIIEPYFKKLFRNKLQIRTLAHLRDALLPQLMSGQMKVKA